MAPTEEQAGLGDGWGSIWLHTQGLVRWSVLVWANSFPGSDPGLTQNPQQEPEMCLSHQTYQALPLAGQAARHLSFTICNMGMIRKELYEALLVARVQSPPPLSQSSVPEAKETTALSPGS